MAFLDCLAAATDFSGWRCRQAAWCCFARVARALAAVTIVTTQPSDDVFYVLWVWAVEGKPTIFSPADKHLEIVTTEEPGDLLRNVFDLFQKMPRTFVWPYHLLLPLWPLESEKWVLKRLRRLFTTDLLRNNEWWEEKLIHCWPKVLHRLWLKWNNKTLIALLSLTHLKYVCELYIIRKKTS